MTIYLGNKGYFQITFREEGNSWVFQGTGEHLFSSLEEYYIRVRLSSDPYLATFLLFLRSLLCYQWTETFVCYLNSFGDQEDIIKISGNKGTWQADRIVEQGKNLKLF